MVLEGISSEEMAVSSRVPQGTVLAPLLFLLFINDIETNIDSQMRLFTDDCLVHRVIKHDLNCLQLQENISSPCHWENTWKMTFNKTKCCVMHMIDKKNFCLSTYNMRGIPLVPTHALKYLGVQLTSNLDCGTRVQPFQPRLIGLSD